MTQIDLHLNQLTVIREKMFSGLHNLEKLYLYSNQIHTIQPRSFKDNIALNTLVPAINSLQNIKQCIFDIDNPPSNLHIFSIHTNPLECENLCWLKKAEAAGWITVYNSHLTVCAGKTAFNGRTWDSLTEQQLCTGRCSVFCF